MERLNTAAAYAINALPADEARLFEAATAADPYLGDHIDSFRRVATELAAGLPEIVPAASPVIWERIAAETGIAQHDIESPQPDPTPFNSRRSRLVGFVAAAAAVLAIGAIGVGLLTNPTSDLRALAGAAAAETGSTNVDLISPTGMPEIAASVVIAADGAGYVIADSLPTLNDDRTYQLWIVVDDQVISAGLLGNDPEVAPFRAEGNIVGIAISNEVAGGVVVSENDPVAIWLRDA